MEESVDVKALRAKFHSRANTSDSSSRDSGSPKSPLPGFGRGDLPGTENGLVRHKLPQLFPLSPSGPGPARFPGSPKPELRAPSTPKLALPQGAFPRPPPIPSVGATAQPTDLGRVKQKGEMLQNMMLKHQKPPVAKPIPGIPSTPSTSAPAPPPVLAPAPAPAPGRQLPSQRTMAGEVTPLTRPLPPEGPRPMKPKRPPNVNLDPYLRSRAPLALPKPRKNDGLSASAGSKPPLPGLPSPSGPGIARPPGPPPRPIKPGYLPHQPASVHVEDNQETYDDIGSLEKHDSWSDNSLQHAEGGSDDSQVYDFIDEDQLEMSRGPSEKKTPKEMKKQQEQEKKDQKERQKRENELRKTFQLQGEVEVLHTARVRHDWHGGKLDLSVRQGDSVEILRVKDNPGGKWLARSLTGNYGYISNTCVDIDYEEVKRKVLQSRRTSSAVKMDFSSELPPPPPDPPLGNDIYYDVDSSDHADSLAQEEDDYDDVQPLSEDFPPPPPEISVDPKLEKELKKKFKFEGPMRVLHTMMVDPNGIIKKPGGKDLAVAQGEILDVIQLASNKKALCRNQFGKYGYVSRSLLLQMEGDIYDDVDNLNDVYDNDSIQ